MLFGRAIRFPAANSRSDRLKPATRALRVVLMALALAPVAHAADWPYAYAHVHENLPIPVGYNQAWAWNTWISSNGWSACSVRLNNDSALLGTVMRRNPTTGIWTDIGYPTDAQFGFSFDTVDIRVNTAGTVAMTIDKLDSPSGIDLMAYRKVGDAGWTLPTGTSRLSQAWRVEHGGLRFLAGRGRDDALGRPLPVVWNADFSFTDVGPTLGAYVGNVDALFGNRAVVTWGSQAEFTAETFRWSVISDITAVSPTITHLTKTSSPTITQAIPLPGGGTGTAVDIMDARLTASTLFCAVALTSGAEYPDVILAVPVATIGDFSTATALPRPRPGDAVMKQDGVNTSGRVVGEAGPFRAGTTELDHSAKVAFTWSSSTGTQTLDALTGNLGFTQRNVSGVADDGSIFSGSTLLVPVPTVDISAPDNVVGGADTGATVRLTRSGGSTLLPLTLALSVPSGVTASTLSPIILRGATTVDVTLTILSSIVGNQTISVVAPIVPPSNYSNQAGVAYNRGTSSTLITNANVVVNPTTTIARSGSGTVTVGQTATITVTFSAAVTGFVSGELVPSQGAISAFSGSGTSYSATWTPPTNTDSTTVNFAVGAGVAQTTSGSNLAATALSVAFDTLAPAAPAISSPANGATIGANPTVTGTVPSGASAISVTAGPASQAATISGTWSAAFTNLSAGSTTISATASDVAGNVSPTTSITVTVDASAPVLTVATITSPTNDNTVDLSGTVDEACELTVRSGSTVVYGPTVAASGAWGPIATSILGDGVRSLSVTATDSLGNATTSSPQSVTVDTTGPTVVLGTPSVMTANSSASPTVAVTYADATTSVNGITLANGNVTVVATDSAAASAAVSGSGTTSRLITLTGLTGNGTITVQVAGNTASDAVGNTASASNLVVITIDTNAPAVAITTPAQTTGDSTPTISGTAEAGVAIELHEGATLLGSATATVGGTWTLDPTTSLAEGARTLVATATDAAGNVGTSLSVVITVDLTPPAAVITSGASTTNDPTPTVSGTAETGATVTLREGSTDLGTTTAAGGTWSINASTLPDGLHELYARAVDAYGNAGDTATVAITIDTVAPSVALGTPSATSNVNADDTVTIVVTYADSGSGLSAVSLATGDVTVTSATGTASATAAITGSGSTRTITLTGFTGDGTLTVSLLAGTAADVAGSSAAAAGPSLAIAVDNTAPTVAITTGTTITADDTPTIAGTSDDATATIELRNGTTVLGTGTVTAGVWSITPTTALAAGAYTLTARGTDVAGNVGSDSASVSITVNLSGPTVVISGGTISGTTATFIATFSAPVTGLTAGEIVIGGTAGGTKVVTIAADATNRIFTITVSGLAAPSGTVTVQIPADVAAALAGDPTLPSNSVSVAFTVPAAVAAAGSSSDGGCGGGSGIAVLLLLAMSAVVRFQGRRD